MTNYELQPTFRESDEKTERQFSMSRRSFVRLGALGFGALMTGNLLTACGPEEKWEQMSLGDLEPEYESEKKMHELLKKYQEVRDASGAESLESALLTQAALDTDDIQGVAGTYKGFIANNAASASEAALLTVSANLPNSDTEEVGRIFEQVRNMDEVADTEAANVTAISSFTNTDVNSVVYYYERVRGEEEGPLVPVMVMDRLLQDGSEDTNARLQAIEALGVTNEGDQAAMLFADTFTNASLEDLNAIRKELEGIEEIDPATRGDLITAAVYNNLDLESTLEAYNYAGTLDGMTKEAAAKLTLALYGEDIPALDQPEETGGEQQEVAAASSSTRTVFIYPYFYPGFFPMSSYGYGVRSSTQFVPTSRGSSFSRPGTAPARGGGRGGVSTGRGGSSTG